MCIRDRRGHAHDPQLASRQSARGAEQRSGRHLRVFPDTASPPPGKRRRRAGLYLRARSRTRSRPSRRLGGRGRRRLVGARDLAGALDGARRARRAPLFLGNASVLVALVWVLGVRLVEARRRGHTRRFRRRARDTRALRRGRVEHREDIDLGLDAVVVHLAPGSHADEVFLRGDGHSRRQRAAREGRGASGENRMCRTPQEACLLVFRCLRRASFGRIARREGPKSRALESRRNRMDTTRRETHRRYRRARWSAPAEGSRSTRCARHRRPREDADDEIVPTLSIIFWLTEISHKGIPSTSASTRARARTRSVSSKGP